MARRAIEIGAALLWAGNTERHVIWGSLTCRHNASSDLEELLRIQREAWRFVVSDRRWRDAGATATVPHVHAGCADDCPLDHDHSGCPASCEKKRDAVLLPRDGRAGYIRAAELTIGGNGWHPHFHPLIIWQGTAVQAAAFAALVVALWVEGVELAGGEAQRDGAQQLRVVTGVRVYEELSRYVTKATYNSVKPKAVIDSQRFALEAVWSQGKTGRGRDAETVTHWSLLAAIARGEADEAARWLELEEATAGHRMITWSRGLRAFAGVGEEVSDEEEAAKEVGTADDTVCFITTDGWYSIRDRPEVLALILATLEAGGWPALRVILDAYRVEYFVLEPASV